MTRKKLTRAELLRIKKLKEQQIQQLQADMEEMHEEYKRRLRKRILDDEGYRFLYGK